MTPLQGAMIAGAVANDGTLMKPYLVNQELAPEPRVLAKTEPDAARPGARPDARTSSCRR